MRAVLPANLGSEANHPEKVPRYKLWRTHPLAAATARLVLAWSLVQFQGTFETRFPPPG